MSTYDLFTAHVVHCLFSESISAIETADSMNSQSIEHDSQEINKRQDIEKKIIYVGRLMGTRCYDLYTKSWTWKDLENLVDW